MTNIPVQIRRAGKQDLPTLAEFGLALAQLHTTFDQRRFVVPDDGTVCFMRFFEAELDNESAVLLLAEIADTPIGYAFVRIEGASLEDLRGAGAWLHDIYVVPSMRTKGAGRRLVKAAFDAARLLGSTSLMLGVSPCNTAGRALFDRMGLRATMIEMRAELSD